MNLIYVLVRLQGLEIVSETTIPTNVVSDI